MILLVNQHTVPLFVDVANAFASSGQRVVLFTGHIELGKRPLDPSVKVVSSKFYNRRSSFSRLWSWMIFTIHYFFYLLFSRKPSKILVVTNPPLAPIVTYWITRIRKSPFYILVYDLYPEALFQAGFTKSGNWLYRLWQRVNIGVFAACNKIFTLSESMKKAAAVYTPGAESKIKVIFNWVDSTYIAPVDRSKNAFAERHKIGEKLVVMYSGNMGLTHDLESIIYSAEALKTRNDILFIFIGEGGKRQRLLDIVSEKKLDNVLFLPYQDAAMFPFAMAAADIGMVTLGIGAEGISVPSKTYVTMAAGLCLITIAPSDSELTRLVEHYKIGLSVQPDQSSELTKTISLLSADRTRLQEFKNAARRTALLFSPDNAKLYVEELSE